MNSANQANLSATTQALEPSASRTMLATAALLGTALLAFAKGFLLCGLLNIIPILPAYKRSTGSILSRTFALFVFGPLSAFVLLGFPLLFVPGYRRVVAWPC
jgi:hypothetical protein